MKWISRLLMLIVLALGYMCLQSAEGPGRLLFVCYNLALLLLWGCTNYSIPSTKSLKLLTASSDLFANLSASAGFPS
jgi:hypothetical protein